MNLSNCRCIWYCRYVCIKEWGHRTKEAREEYTRQLLEEFNKYYTAISVLTRSKCPRFGHLDEHSVSSRAHALRMIMRSRQLGNQHKAGTATLTLRYNIEERQGYHGAVLAAAPLPE